MKPGTLNDVVAFTCEKVFFTELRQGGSSELFVCAALERARLRTRSGKDSFVMIAVVSLNYIPSTRGVLNSYIGVVHSVQEGCLAPKNAC